MARKRGSAAEDYRLDFGAGFYLNRRVSAAEDELSSWTAVGSAAAGQRAAASFTTTHWSVVLEAQGDTPAAQRALEILCRTYWRPLYGFVRRHGLGREEAQDLVQEFFARLLEHRNLDAVRREKGRLRSYLLVSLKRFLTAERHRASGVKRYESGPHIPLDELREVADFELAETWSADRLYERHWALAVLEQVLGRLESEYRAAGPAAAGLFDRLKEFLVGEPELRTQAEIATELGMTENAVKQAFHRFRHRYRLLLREEIAHTVAQAGDVEGELRHLVSVLRT
ncbi:MAG TPA: sigma-70 family RNA polymerase sigma factor [Candidatus Udaeobacter sp.]|nr:sigma-70 family RNA polymerase sigma factor [Candidatus Udaeobacter sp.]